MNTVALAIGLSVSFAHGDGDFTSYVIAGELELSGRDAYHELPTVCPWTRRSVADCDACKQARS